MDIVRLKLKGAAPLLMHSDRGANPLDPDTARFTQYRKVKSSGRTDEWLANVLKMEFMLGLYHDSGLGPYLPTANLRKALEEGAALSKLKSSVRRAVICDGDRAPLAYAGPRDKEGLWADRRFRDIRTIKNGNSRVPRCRAVFKEWSLSVAFHFDPSMIDREKVIFCLQSAGAYIGVGDYRPVCGGQFGRFTVEEEP